MNVQHLAKNKMISIITPFYNSDRFLDETIKSVVNQSLSDWELLLINDGSTDNSVNIASQWVNRDNRIKLLQYDIQENKGKCYARNLGIERSNGEYLCFLDSDDVFVRDKLLLKLKYFESDNDTDMVMGNTIYWNDWLDQVSTANEYPTHQLIPDRIYRKPDLVPLLVGKLGAMPCICSFVVKKSVVEKVGDFSDGFTNLYEDQAFITKLFCNANIYVLDGYYEYYRQRDDSDWHRSRNDGTDKEVGYKYNKWLLRYLQASKYSNAEIINLLKHSTRRYWLKRIVEAVIK